MIEKDAVTERTGCKLLDLDRNRGTWDALSDIEVVEGSSQEERLMPGHL